MSNDESLEGLNCQIGNHDGCRYVGCRCRCHLEKRREQNIDLDREAREISRRAERYLQTEAEGRGEK